MNLKRITRIAKMMFYLVIPLLTACSSEDPATASENDNFVEKQEVSYPDSDKLRPENGLYDGDYKNEKPVEFYSQVFVNGELQLDGFSNLCGILSGRPGAVGVSTKTMMKGEPILIEVKGDKVSEPRFELAPNTPYSPTRKINFSSGEGVLTLEIEYSTPMEDADSNDCCTGTFFFKEDGRECQFSVKCGTFDGFYPFPLTCDSYVYLNDELKYRGFFLTKENHENGGYKLSCNKEKGCEIIIDCPVTFKGKATMRNLELNHEAMNRSDYEWRKMPDGYTCEKYGDNGLKLTIPPAADYSYNEMSFKAEWLGTNGEYGYGNGFTITLERK